MGGAFAALAGQRPAHLGYPEKLGRWPAAIALLGFVWLEVVYGSNGGVAVGLSPHVTGVAALVYSGYTLAMMALFGVEKWCDRGEAFSVYFGMLSQLAPFGVRDGRLGRRRPLSASTHWATVPGSVAVVIASIASTSFDGAQEGAFKEGIDQRLQPPGRRRFRPRRRPAPLQHDLHGADLRRGRAGLPARGAGDARRCAAPHR